MRKSLLSLLTGAALLGTVAVASAAEPMVLSTTDMDSVTAAGRVYKLAPNRFLVRIGSINVQVAVVNQNIVVIGNFANNIKIEAIQSVQQVIRQH